MLPKIYFISGLGADASAFNELDLSFCEAIFLDWITPLPKESIPQYALRLRNNISDKHPLIVGVSFGGMLATEIARQDKDVQAIIISSNKRSAEFPPYIKWIKYLPLYKLLPGKAFHIDSINNYFLGTAVPFQEKVNAVIKATDNQFLKWAIGAILNWKDQAPPNNVTHIHGSNDKLLPYYNKMNAQFIIKGGSHLMILDKANEISVILKQVITRY